MSACKLYVCLLMLLVIPCAFGQQESASPAEAGSQSAVPAQAPVNPVVTVQPTQQGTRSDQFNGSPFTVVIALAFVVALIFATAWVLRKAGGGALTGSANMRIIAGISVGTREKVLLVDVGGKQVLIGVAPGRVSSLHCFDEPVLSGTEPQESDFAQKIRRFMQPGVPGDSSSN